MNGFVGTVISGTIGLAALYVAGKIAFKAGHDLAEVEFRCKQLKDIIESTETKDKAIVTDEPEQVILSEKKQSKLRMLFSLRKVIRKSGKSVIGNLIQYPENHMLEACVKGQEIHLTVKPKSA